MVADNAEQLLMLVGPDNVAHVLWEEISEATGEWALLYWNSASASLDELGDTAAGEARYMVLDDQDQVNVTWIADSGTGEGQDLWFWNPAEGVVMLSDPGATEGDVAGDSLVLVRDDGGRVYAVWAEASGTAEGDDLFGAWTFEEPTEYLYLPLVVR